MVYSTCNRYRFILDSGATHHVVANNLILDNYVKVSKHSKPAYIYCANGSKLQIFGTGDIGRHIRGVFYVPGASVNIISVSQLTKGGHLVTFTETEVLFDNICIGALDQNLYRVKPSLFNIQDRPHEVAESDVHIPEYELIKNDLTSSNRNLDLLHRRFGHANVAEIQKLIKVNAVDGLELKTHHVAEQFHCDSCHIAKAVRKSRDPSLKYRSPVRSAVKAENFFNLVHADLIGPLSKESIRGNYYGISFTEVQSRYRWFYAIRSKDDAINAFKTFLAEVSGYGMGFSVKMLKTDNGASNDFAQLLQPFSIVKDPASSQIESKVKDL